MHRQLEALNSEIVVVTGLPRSGTSLMMQLLEAGGISPVTDQARKADVDNPAGYYELEAVKTMARDASWVAGAPGRAVKVLQTQLRDLPADHRYRILCMRRHLDEVVRSQHVMRHRLGGTMTGLPDAQLASILLHQLNATIAWARCQPNMTLLEVHYNALVTDPTPHLHRINGFLGGGLGLDAMAGIINQELYRVRRW